MSIACEHLQSRNLLCLKQHIYIRDIRAQLKKPLEHLKQNTLHKSYKQMSQDADCSGSHPQAKQTLNSTKHHLKLFKTCSIASHRQRLHEQAASGKNFCGNISRDSSDSASSLSRNKRVGSHFVICVIKILLGRVLFNHVADFCVVITGEFLRLECCTCLWLSN